MELESVFYIVGAIFAFAAVVYFAYEYLITISRWLKLFMLVVLCVLVYVGARELHRRDM